MIAACLLTGLPGSPAWAQGDATLAPATRPFENEIVAFEKRDQASPPPKGAVLFLGSSSIRLWTNAARDFPEFPVINRGFGGSMISDSVAYAERIVLPYEPRLIVFYAGGNDLNAGKPPEQVAADFREFAGTVLARLPDTEIAYVSIAPSPKRWSQVEKVKAANALIADYCRATPRLKFIDVFSHMLGPDGQPKAGIYRDDQLHMNAEGYKIWVPLIRPYLARPDRVPAGVR